MVAKTAIFSVTVRNEAETAALAARLADFLSAQDVISLSGTLGAGKTAFARALIRSLCGNRIEVPSPTFNLLLTYECERAPVYHYDFYRIEDPEEVWELDIEDALHEGITVMEWAEKLEDLAPEEMLSVSLTIPDGGDGDMRVIEFFGNSEWRERLQELADIKRRD